MAFNRIKQLLQQSMGLHAGAVGDSSIERAIRQRMAVVGAARVNQYLSLLQHDRDELDELVEEVVVPETWFFRNQAPFEALVRCLPRLQRDRAGDAGPLRILSVPCSTGEEPYSIAMTLLEHDLTENDFQIDAVDISRRALTKARRAIYGRHSFREEIAASIVQGDFREKYFRRGRSGLKLLPMVRERVGFTRANLLQDDIGPSASHYHVVFCRNILIYFDAQTQQRVVQKLHTMLKPSGLLFVGHAEASQIGKSLFRRLDQPKSFAFQKQASSSEATPAVGVDELHSVYDQLVEVTRRDLQVSRRKHTGKSSATRVARAAGPGPTKQQKTGTDSDQVDWPGVERLIGQARYAEATTLCEQHLRTEPESSLAYYLLGLISSLQGSPGAAETLVKKSVYLDPNNHRALGLAAVLADQRGDSAAAESLRRRQRRAESRET